MSNVQDTGKDPVTGAEASADELLAVKNNTVRSLYLFQPPRRPHAYSLCLSTFDPVQLSL